MNRLVLDGYDRVAPDLFERYDALDTREVNAPIMHLVPSRPSRVLDVGAGTGRDAAWLAAFGHNVVAVEPTHGLREGGKIRHSQSDIEWLDDRLPELESLAARPDVFDFIKLTAVWAHLNPDEQRQSLGALANLLAPGGVLAFSIRCGAAPSDRPVHNVEIGPTIAHARSLGLSLLLDLDAPSVQPANRALGVTWTWLAFEASRAQ